MDQAWPPVTHGCCEIKNGTPRYLGLDVVVLDFDIDHVDWAIIHAAASQEVLAWQVKSATVRQ